MDGSRQICDTVHITIEYLQKGLKFLPFIDMVNTENKVAAIHTRIDENPLATAKHTVYKIWKTLENIFTCSIMCAKL